MITPSVPFVGLGFTPRAGPDILDLGQGLPGGRSNLPDGGLLKTSLMSIPVVLVAGFSQAARHRVIRDALNAADLAQASSGLSGQGPAPQVAWLDHQDRLMPAAQGERQPHQSFMACVCCAGSLVFTTHLARILRQGPWAGLLISLGARAEPARMLELLSRAPWSEHLGPMRLFSVMDAASLALCEQKDHALQLIAYQQKTRAEQVLQPGEPLPKDLFGWASRS